MSMQLFLRGYLTDMQLSGRRIHIAGSADVEASSSLLSYSHSLVRALVWQLAEEGATFLSDFGREPKSGAAQDGPAVIFYWTVADALEKALTDNVAFPVTPQGPILLTLVTTKTDAQIPESRRSLYSGLRNRGAVGMDFLEPGWSSGALRRERQSQLGDILIAISGGEGIEHLAREYSRRGKPVIPLDLRLGGSSRDGSGGAAKLFEEALADSRLFFTVSPSLSGPELLERTRTRQGNTPFADVASNVFRLLDAILPPRVFYVRMLNKKLAEYPNVERFFRTVADVVVQEFGFQPIEIGTSRNDYAWINEAIFDSLHHSQLVLIDLTGLRPNCVMELGYALGNQQRVMVTAQVGTEYPFDSSCIETYPWDLALGEDTLRRELRLYWARNLNRPPLVKARSLR